MWRPPAESGPTASPHKESALRTYVFSRTLQSIDQPGVELVKAPAVEFIRGLKRRPGKGICLLGGGELAQSLLEAGLVDRIGFEHSPDTARLGRPHIARSRASGETETDGLPSPRRRMCPCELQRLLGGRVTFSLGPMAAGDRGQLWPVTRAPRQCPPFAN